MVDILRTSDQYMSKHPSTWVGNYLSLFVIVPLGWEGGSQNRNQNVIPKSLLKNDGCN